MASRVHFKNEKLKKLAGKRWTVAGTEYQFADYKNRAVTGKPPWKGGGEGGAYPLLSRSGQTILYLKFFSHQTLQRKSRTQWLIAQRVGEWLLELRGAPRSWWDTRQVGRPQEIDFDIEGSVCPAVSGMTWAEVKTAIEQQRASPSIEVRKRCVKHLLRALAVLESAGFVHGDLSPNNVIVDFNGQRTQPALYLIDFDSFVCGAAGPELAQLDDSINAKHGTPGYYPPSLDQQPDPVPFSDRYARDMLLLELMCYSRRFPADDALSSWDAQAKLALEEIRKQTWLVGQLSHLRIPEVFVLPERKRPTSAELCRLIGISVPSRPKIRPRARPRTTQHRRVHPAGTLAVLVCVSVVLLAFVSNSASVRGNSPRVLPKMTPLWFRRNQRHMERTPVAQMGHAMRPETNREVSLAAQKKPKARRNSILILWMSQGCPQMPHLGRN